MTWEERQYCKTALIGEIRAAFGAETAFGVDGTVAVHSAGGHDAAPSADGLIASLEAEGFFEKGCTGHDEAPGGAANHALWCLQFAREMLDEAEGPEPGTEGHLHGLDSESPAEAPAPDQAALILGAIHHGPGTSEVIAMAEAKAVSYCDSIPYGAPAEEGTDVWVDDEFVDSLLDNDEHRLWIGGSERDYEGIGDHAEFPCHLAMTLAVRGEGNGPDVAVLTDDAGSYAIMVLVSEDGEQPVFVTDRRIFGYTDFVFYVTRYPQYRSSYVAARNAKGRWGLLALREDRKRRSGQVMTLEKVVDFTYRHPAKAAGALHGRDGRLIGVTDPDFFTEINLRDFI